VNSKGNWLINNMDIYIYIYIYKLCFFKNGIFFSLPAPPCPLSSLPQNQKKKKH
jgi:hypothetical protein